MNLALLAAGLGLVALPGLIAPIGRRVGPDGWARLAAASLRVGLASVRLGLLLTAVPTLVQLAGVESLAEACHHTLAPVSVGGAAAASAGAAVLGAAQLRMAMARRRSRAVRRTLRVEPWLGRHLAHRDHELVIVPTSSTFAYALDGQPPQIVVSQGLTAALTDDELTAVVRHEHCHLRYVHHRYVELALLAEAALGPIGPVRRSGAALRLAVERWADELAASQSGRTVLRGALLKVVDTMVAPVPAFGAADTVHARLAALDADPPTNRAGWRVAAASPVLALAAAVVLILLAADVYHGALLAADIHHGILGFFCHWPF